MTWVPALAIGGAILALGPIIIHIIFRRRYRTIDFAAMRFLLESLRRNKQRVRIQELIIIALRCLACLLIGFMLANIRSATPFAGAAAATAHVFVLDDSLSMSQQIGTTTLFQKALTFVSARITDLPDADLVGILSAGRPKSGEPLGKLAPVIDIKRGNFTSRLAASRPTDLVANLAGALREAHELIKGTSDPMPVKIYVVSDFRRRDFTGAERTEELRKAFAAFDEKTTELVLLDFGVPCKDNLAVERVALGRKVVVSGASVPLRVTVRNTGSLASDETKLSVAVGEAKLPALAVPALMPGESADINLRYTFKPAGFAAVEAALPVDTLAADNSSALAIAVRESVRALIVDGSPDPRSRKSASFCLAHAFDPSRRGSFAQVVDVRQAELWKPSSVDMYDLVILTDVRDFPAGAAKAGGPAYPHLEALEKYVRNGGGLGVFVGPNVSADFYNGPFFADGRGLCPVQLSPEAFRKPDPQKFTRFDPQSIGPVPMLRIFTGRSRRFADLVRFHVFAPLQTVSAVSSDVAGPANVLARFDDEGGSPAAVQRTYGSGTVIFWTTAADTAWSNWPKDLSFLPVMNDMAWELVRPARDDFTAVVGQRISYALPGRLQEATAALLKTPAYPEEDIVTLDIHHDGRDRVVQFADARYAGVYEMTLSLPDRTEQAVYFTRRVDPTESVLEQATEGQLSGAVDREYRYVPNMAVSETAAEEEAPRKAFWWIFMAILLVVIALESFLAQRFGHYQPRVGSALESAA